MVLRATAGEPFADSEHRPSIELIEDGVAAQLFGEEHGPTAAEVAGPADAGVRGSAACIRGVLEGEHGVPLPLANQLACCLYASGYASDFNQAKAIVAVETRGLAAA